jgi:hypothetical protein
MIASPEARSNSRAGQANADADAYLAAVRRVLGAVG